MDNISIFFASDNEYAPQVAIAIASICSNTDKFCDFYVLNNDINQINIDKITKLSERFKNFSIEFVKVNLNDYFKNLKITKTFPSLIMYSRFLFPDIKTKVNKAIYTDPDIIAMGDISKMYNEDLNGHSLGAVWEEFGENSLNIERKKRLNLNKNHKYFSSGNLLIDCKKWRQEKILEKLSQILKNQNLDLKHPDQDVLNICFQNNYKLLDKKYCYLSCYEKSNSQVIRHFSEYPKPWLADFYLDNRFPKPIFNRELFWKYAKMTPYYFDLLNKREEFLSQKFIYKRFNAMVNKMDNIVYEK